jgi:hypothetical protein
MTIQEHDFTGMIKNLQQSIDTLLITVAGLRKRVAQIEKKQSKAPKQSKKNRES